MTPEDILNKKFDRATMGGYRADDVNAFMGSVAELVEDLAAERSELQNKLIVLADKLSEYRSDEESMRSALLGAQKLGDTIVRDSKTKAESLLEDAVQEAETILATAKGKADKISSDAKVNLESETLALQRMQREVSQFKKKMLSMYQQQMDLIASIPLDIPEEIENLAPPIPTPIITNIAKKAGVSPAVEMTEEIYENARFVEDEAAPLEGYPEESSPLFSPKRKPKEEEDDDFVPLQFGAGFRVLDEE